jgi:hypothetical protein
LKKTVKALVLITAISLSSASSSAQLKLPIGNAAAQSFRKVIEDYPQHFSHITGNMIADNGGTIEFTCTSPVQGEEESRITRHVSGKPIYSWQATMLTTESFEKARQKFKSLFGQLNNLSVNLDGNSYKLKAGYSAPSEEMKFNSILFSALPEQDIFKKLKTELVLQFYPPMEWKVKLLVYEKEREDNEQGEQRDGN